ncbi:MAG: radical SAM protein [Candidatus Omnitrophica bacterium]|nr:radical SAM protein [Candidatus Omnitrophota bacterium]
MKNGLCPGIIGLDSEEKYKRLFSAKEGNAASFRSGHVVLKAGEGIGEHNTGDFEEILIILEGKGELYIKSSGGTPEKVRIQEFAKDTALYVPPDTLHDVKNTGAGMLKYVFITCPACVKDQQKCTSVTYCAERGCEQVKRPLYDYIYGPVPSWRLGSSLGVDLLSQEEKICVFDCVYCQIGSTPIKTVERKVYVPTEKVIKEIKSLPAGLSIDHITFSGRGEPTLARNFGEIIRKIRELRREKIAVITNSSLMRDKSVRDDLALADLVMVKLDAATQECFEKINAPADGIRLSDLLEGIKAFRSEHDTKLALQIMFAEMNKDEYKKLAELAFEIRPDEIQINTPLRPCGIKPLSKHEIVHIKEYFEDLGRKTGSISKIIVVYEAEHKRAKAIDRRKTLKRRGSPQ